MTEVETTVDATRAAQLVGDLRGVARMAEPALQAEELQTLSEVAEFLEGVACIRSGERFMESELTGQTYRVTRWIDLGDGKFVSLAKEAVEA